MFRLLSEFFAALGALLLPLAVSLAACVFFTVPDQTIEVYRALAVISYYDEDLRAKLIEIGFAAIGLIAMTVVLRFSSYSVTATSNDVRTPPSRFQNGVHWLAATALCVLPILACGYGVLRARTGTPPPQVMSAAKLAMAKALGFEGETAEGLADNEFVAASLDFYFTGDGNLYRASMVLFALASLVFLAVAILDRGRVKTVDWVFAPRLRRAYDWRFRSSLSPLYWHAC